MLPCSVLSSARCICSHNTVPSEYFCHPKNLLYALFQSILHHPLHWPFPALLSIPVNQVCIFWCFTSTRPYRRRLCVWCHRASSVPVVRFVHNTVCVTAFPFTAAYEAFVWILFSLHVWSPDDGRLDCFQAAALSSHAVLGICIGVCGLVLSFLLGRWLGMQSLCPRASGTLVPCVSPPLICEDPSSPPLTNALYFHSLSFQLSRWLS